MGLPFPEPVCTSPQHVQACATPCFGRLPAFLGPGPMTGKQLHKLGQTAPFFLLRNLLAMPLSSHAPAASPPASYQH